MNDTYNPNSYADVKNKLDLMARLCIVEPDYVWTCEALTICDVLPHRLELFSLGVNAAPDGSRSWMAKERMGYRFYTGDTMIFEGVDFFVPLGMSRNMPRVALELLCFLTLREGDTDDEYFDDYTPEQLVWRDYYAEDMCAEVYAQMDGMTS